MMEAASFSIERIAPSAASSLKRLPRKQQEAVAEAFDYMCNVSPFHHPNPKVIRQLKGEYKGLWRYRVGNIRIIYSVNEERRTFVLLKLIIGGMCINSGYSIFGRKGGLTTASA